LHFKRVPHFIKGGLKGLKAVSCLEVNAYDFLGGKTVGKQDAKQSMTSGKVIHGVNVMFLLGLSILSHDHDAAGDFECFECFKELFDVKVRRVGK
jgi:hypothetical protein